MDRKWWKEAVIYQVYPKSFKDSDGNGVGDLKGILSQLDYIASIGVNAVWINPVYASPGADNGYDICDFRAIDPIFGTMEDLQQVIDGIHARRMRVILDMVVNHTSDEHWWFQQARRSRDDPHYGWYHWWPAEKGSPPHRCGFFDPEGKAWEYNAATDSYYLHYFSPRQPDLNWENAEVRQEIHAMLRFWLDKGVDGFRMDAITYISKDTAWPEIGAETLKEKFDNDWGNYYATGPALHAYLREMHAAVLNGTDAVIIGECSGVAADSAAEFVAADRKELDMLYQFEAITVGYLPGAFKRVDPKGWSRVKFKEVYSRWDRLVEKGGWNTLYLGNHDQPRMVSRWGDDRDAFREVSAKLLFTFLLTMRGTPSLYNGDELGMTNIRFRQIGEYQDIETKQKYAEIRENRGDTEAFLVDQQLAARDNSRTPFQWSAERHAGFTEGEPWMTVNENYRAINAAIQEGDEDSVLQYVRRLVQFRREQVFNVESEGNVVINNYREVTHEGEMLRLAPWQAVVIAV